jgi:hypothetical protein
VISRKKVLSFHAVGVILAFSIGISEGWAGARNTIPGSRYLSARAAGMGDAFLTLAEDTASGLFVNPAGLANGKDMRGEFVNIGVETNQDFVGGADINSIKVTSLPSYFPSLPDGEYPSVGLSLLPNFSAPGFGLGLLLQSRISASQSGGTVNYRSSYRFVPAFGMGARLAGGMFRLGYSLQYVNQAEGEVTGVPSSSSPLGYNQQLAQGSGISHNVGVTIAIPITYLPTFSVVARNVMGLRFSDFCMIPFARNSPGAPTTEPMSVDAAFSLQPRFRGGGFMSYVIQLKDATNQSGFSIMDRAALGVEMNLKGVFALRAGYTLGDIQAGVGFKTSRADVNLSWHTEELGTAAASVRDRRWLFQYVIKAF